MILFICEHGSAKSTIAAAHCERLARERGIETRSISRGTDPDAEYPPHVLAGLEADGLEPQDRAPVALSREDIDSASTIITFCSRDLLPDNVQIEQVWDDVPAVSEDYSTARSEIVRRIEQLLR